MKDAAASASPLRISGPSGDPVLSTALERLGLTRLPSGWPAPLDRISVDEVRRAIAAAAGPRPTDDDTLQRAAALVSPAARTLLEPMAQAAAALTRQRHGRAILLYAPLYLSNACVNACRYCGFRAGGGATRRRLTDEEVEAEASLLAADGFRDILLVAGEDPEAARPGSLAGAVRRLLAPGATRPAFASVCLEVAPLNDAGYRELVAVGIDGVTLYQETYDRQTYAEWHPHGPKADYEARLRAQEAAARAGVRRLGIGALLGLQDWRFETLALVAHALTLLRHCRTGRISFSFPRLRPAPGAGFTVPHPVADADLAQMIVALRLLFPDAGLTLSTREPAALRDRLLPLGITQMSAGSSTRPGGYAARRGGDADGGAQFEVADDRPAAEVAAALRAGGYDPVWRDWA